MTRPTADSDDLQASESSSDMSTILLEGQSISLEGSGATVNGSSVTITSAGTYSISGVLNNGQIVVDTADEENVFLVLNGVNLTYTTGAPIYVANAEKTIITLAEGTENIVTDGASYLFPDAETDETNAAVFSKDDLTINGSGSLTVYASYNNGITSKDDLLIAGGNITVNAANDGIKGRDSLTVLDGTITVNAGGDGLQANNDEDATEGIVVIDGGTLMITAGLDGIQAETMLAISGGKLAISSGGGSGASVVDSAKGLKAGVDITIAGGNIQVDAADDAVHSNGSITISGGELVLTSGDDGVHADALLLITGGDLSVARSYEGLESSIIVINDGTITLTSSDDGINVAGGSDGSGMMGPGQDSFTASGDKYLEINGGFIVVNAGGDSLDANGPAALNGGTVVINGPLSPGGGNGMLDVDGSLTINGGLLAAVGSTGMGININGTSAQYAVVHSLPSVQAAGTTIHIVSADGQEILSYTPTEAYQTILVSAPGFENGATYSVYVGDTQVFSFTISGVVTGATSGTSGMRKRG